MTLPEFLRARLDGLQQQALGSGRVAWLTYRDDGSMRYTTVAAATLEDSDVWCVDGREAIGWTSAQVIYDEAEVLAEVDAKRRIVDWLLMVRRGEAEDSGEPMPVDPQDQVLRLLALPYAAHPDYDESWRP